jgi:hypothetical protein
MKKIFLLLFVSAFILSCNEENANFDRAPLSDSGWVEITEIEDQYQAPFGFKANIDIALGVGNNEAGQVITYSVEQTSGLPQQGLATGTFTYTMPVGEVFGKIPVDFVDNGSAYEVEVTLLSSSNPNYTVGLSDNTKKVAHTFKVCGFLLDEWIGTYSVEEAFIEGGNTGLSLGSFFRESYQIDVTADPSDAVGTSLILANSPGFNNYLEPNLIVTFDTCNPNLFVNAEPLIALFSELTIESSTYDSSARTITVIGQLGPFGTYRFILTKM